MFLIGLILDVDTSSWGWGVVTLLPLCEDTDDELILTEADVTGGGDIIFSVETVLGLMIDPTCPTGVDFIFSVLTSGVVPVVTLANAEEDPIVEELDNGEDLTVAADVIMVLFDI